MRIYLRFLSLAVAVMAVTCVLNASGDSESQIYRIDTEKSKVEWFCGGHTGYVTLKGGTLVTKSGVLSEGRIELLMDSIVNTDIDYELMRITLQNILKSKDFFNAGEFPVSTFTISEVRNIQNNEYCISGDMKIQEAVRFISFHSRIDIRDDMLIADSEKFIIDRTKWGITTMSKNYVTSKESFIVADEVSIKIHLVAREGGE